MMRFREPLLVGRERAAAPPLDRLHHRASGSASRPRSHTDLLESVTRASTRQLANAVNTRFACFKINDLPADKFQKSKCGFFDVVSCQESSPVLHSGTEARSQCVRERARNLFGGEHSRCCTVVVFAKACWRMRLSAWTKGREVRGPIYGWLRARTPLQPRPKPAHILKTS